MTGDQCKAIIGSQRLAAIRDCLQDAVHDYDADASPLKVDHTHGSICSIRHDCIIKRVKQMTLDQQGMRYCQVNQKDLLVIDDRIWMAFNLLGKDHLVRVNDTKQTATFFGQGFLLSDEDKPDERVNVVAGYTVDKFESASDFLIVCPKNSRQNHWEIWLSMQPMESILDGISPTPTPPTRPFTIPQEKEDREEEKKRGTGD